MRTSRSKMHAAARAVNRVPMWLIQIILGIVLTGSVSWATWSTKTTMGHDTRIAVVETKETEVEKNIIEIKGTEALIASKLDRLLERGNNGVRSDQQHR